MLKDIEFDIAGVKTYANLNLINNLGDKYPFLTLLGID